MNQDYYKFIVSPENIKSDITYVDDDGVKVGVYSAMTQVVSGGPNGSSILTGLTVNILLRSTGTDPGYYSVFDGAIYQKDVVTNFIFSAVSEYTYNVYNTSSEIQKFLSLSPYTIDWGDGVVERITNYAPNFISHDYPIQEKDYTITLSQTNPWGITKVSKKIKTPYKNVEIPNPKGEAFFIPAGGNWSGTPVSYDYIFSGDAVNVVSAQTSDDYVQVPFNVSGFSKSRLNELKQYGPNPFQVGVPVISKGQIWGVVDNISQFFTAYTVNGISYYDYSNGRTIYFAKSSGFTDENLTAVPIAKEEMFIKVIDQPQVQTNVFVERGKNSAYERIQRLGEIDNLGDMLNYGYGFYNVQNKD